MRPCFGALETAAGCPEEFAMRAAIGACLALGLLSGSAVAADLGPYRPPGSIKDFPEPVFVPPFSWTGFYIGAQVGHGWGESSFDPDVFPPPDTVTWDHDGWFAGGYAGFNWQVNALVLGVEGDFNGADIDGSTNVVPFTFRSEIDSIASIRGRLGLAAHRWLFFATGGWAWADASHTQELAADPSTKDTEETTLDGWTAGAGVEYAFTAHVIGRVEYRHYDFDSESLDTGLVTGPGKFDADLDTVSVGIGIKF
jgi:outer membrane immunogenic protein